MNLYQEIQDTVEELGEWYRFPVRKWTPKAISETGIDPRKWLSTVTEAIPHIEIRHHVELTRTLDPGILRGYWSENDKCTPFEFYDFCTWLLSRDSAGDRNTVSQEAWHLMAGDARGSLLSTEIAYGWGFDEERKKLRSEYEARIEKLEAQIRKMREEHRQEIEELMQGKSIPKRRKK